LRATVRTLVALPGRSDSANRISTGDFKFSGGKLPFHLSTGCVMKAWLTATAAQWAVESDLKAGKSRSRAAIPTIGITSED